MGVVNKTADQWYSTKECPICGAGQSQEEWPQAGTHAYTVPFTCGTELDCAIGDNEGSFGVSCNGVHKRFGLDKFLTKYKERDVYS